MAYTPPWANLKLREELSVLLDTTLKDLKPILKAHTDEHLLELLKEERGKYTDSSQSMMEELVGELVERKVYPTEWNGNRIDVMRRVQGYGTDWHQFKGILNCPHCQADLRELEHGPPFKREIGIYDMGRDRTVAWQCPDCKKEWPR